MTMPSVAGACPVPPRRVHGAQAPTEQIRILITPAQKAEIKGAADQAGIPMSEYVMDTVRRRLARKRALGEAGKDGQ